MKKILLFLAFLAVFKIGSCELEARAPKVRPSRDCFLIKQANKIIRQEGNCQERYSPCSTFKIALALMGFDSGILKKENEPVWPFEKGYSSYLPTWKMPQTPQSWIKNSCVWYSQVLTQKLGMNPFKTYVTLFNYGNQDLSGDVDVKGRSRNNGLTNAWLSSSLEISAEEQVEFLQKLNEGVLQVSKAAHDYTKKILYLQMLDEGWKLYGKTGSGNLLDGHRQKTPLKHGWFVGWLEKADRRVYFAYHLTDSKLENIHGGLRAKEIGLKKLKKYVRTLES